MGYITLCGMGKWRTGCVPLSSCQGALQLAKSLQDHMERFWSNSIFKYLRVEPEDHYFLLTEPVRALYLPMNPTNA